jgi:RHH-type transcriptional regulator, proline utilization regulon repressor / proline dehydrogenase / delta 1-pyrroline-5-carboxylate dehydrogenase
LYHATGYAMASTNIDDQIISIGREIFRRVSAIPTSANTLDEAMMNLSMCDEAIKTQLFRFVDVLAALSSPPQISRHLREYLQIVRNRLPKIAALAADYLPTEGFATNIIATAARIGAGRMARRFIAAGDVESAIIAVSRLRSCRLAFTLDLLGEAVVSETEADQYQRQYLELVEKLPPRLAEWEEDSLLDHTATTTIPRANLSLKLSSLYSQFDPIDPDGTEQAVLHRLRPILRQARRSGAFINLDMEQFSFKDLTLRIFMTVCHEEEFRDWPNVGIAIQAYLKSTLDDLKQLAHWARHRGTPVWVRLVKGAYWDYETIIAAQNDWPNPVFTDKAATDANFESAAQFLIQHADILHPAIASHNIRSIAASLAFAQCQNLRKSDIEFQMLYGMAEPIKSALVAMGHRVRVYMPFGRLLPGMAYLVRRLLENTSNESFLRAGFVEHLPQEQLLMNPKLKIAPPQPPAAREEFSNEPPTDFSIASERAAISAALLRRTTTTEHPLIIGGRRILTGIWIDSINPSHKSQLVGRVARATPDHANQAIAAAKAAFPAWRDTSVEDRAALLNRVADILHRDRFSLMAIEIAECGKPWRDADADIAEAIDFCRYYAWQMRLLSAPQGNDIPGEQNRWSYDPRGIAVVIAPWNFPLAILCGMASAAVVAGNPVILKPAEQSPLIAAALAAAFEEAGAPPGVVNYLPGIGEEIGPILTTHPDVAMIVFTGSRAVGLGINEQASRTPPSQDHIKRIITEMGGKNAIIVDDDADLDDAVSGIINSAFGYSGQKCSACSRVVALSTIHDSLLDRLIEAARSLKIAPAEDPACRVGPVIDADAFARIHQTIEQAKSQAQSAYAGDVGPLADEGFFIAPHIFANVPRTSLLATEEIFGPVLSVLKAADLDDALAISNGVKYALTGGVYSRSPANIDRCRRDFRVGNLYINRRITGALVGRQPFGGFKLSGPGTQAGGPDYLRNFLLPRCITENTVRHGFVPQMRNSPPL